VKQADAAALAAVVNGSQADAILRHFHREEKPTDPSALVQIKSL